MTEEKKKRPNKYTQYLGKLIEVEYYDHFTGENQTCVLRTVGVMEEENRKYIFLVNEWTIFDEQISEKARHAILKNTIRRIRILNENPRETR